MSTLPLRNEARSIGARKLARLLPSGNNLEEIERCNHTIIIKVVSTLPPARNGRYADTPITDENRDIKDVEDVVLLEIKALTGCDASWLIRISRGDNARVLQQGRDGRRHIALNNLTTINNELCNESGCCEVVVLAD